jgi:ribonucleotide monophosphatase NagD (HAD superfamily)
MIMIGDRLDTDMLLAKNAGIDGCLVLSGVTRSQEDMIRISQKDSLTLPKFFMQSLGIIEDEILSKRVES